MSETTAYELMGGAPALRSLVDRFYFYMDILPEAQGIRAMHAENLAGAKDKLFKFLSGWLGGPNLFIEEFGHPMLRRRHFPFVIGPAERDQWMLCMNRALAEINIGENLRQALQAALQQLATHMINRDVPPDSA
ncbi:MAG: group II truncated hemoglobin [Methylomonas sp.]|jgi:hemoglobin